jgi:hypothetical protein
MILVPYLSDWFPDAWNGGTMESNMSNRVRAEHDGGEKRIRFSIR